MVQNVTSSSLAALLGAVLVGVFIGAAGTCLSVGRRRLQTDRVGGGGDALGAERKASSFLKREELTAPTSSRALQQDGTRPYHGKHRGRAELADLSDGIHGLLREWQCGAGNMQPPKTIFAGGFGSIIVDIGLGEDAAETMAAVQNGFVVLAFEPMPDNLANIRARYGNAQNVQFVQLHRDASGKGWELPPLRRRQHGGFAYIIHAAVGDEDTTVSLPRSGNNGALGSLAAARGRSNTIEVPSVRLDSVLPSWASSVHLLKIDTQGYELKVLRGAINSLRALRFRYVLYEFSPWLMKQANLGEPFDLLRLMPGMGGLCFDMMGTHNMFPHPQRPLTAYYDGLYHGANSYMYGNQLSELEQVPPSPAVGPWDDIMCWFPHAGERSFPMQEGQFGHLKYNESGSFGARYRQQHGR